MVVEDQDDWRKDIGRCVLNELGACLAKIPDACVCQQMSRAVFEDARNRILDQAGARSSSTV